METRGRNKELWLFVDSGAVFGFIHEELRTRNIVKYIVSQIYVIHNLHSRAFRNVVCCVSYADMRRRSHNTPTIDGVWCACASELFLDRLSRKFEVLKDSSQFVKLTRFSYRFKLKNVHEKSRNSNKRQFSS